MVVACLGCGRSGVAVAPESAPTDTVGQSAPDVVLYRRRAARDGLEIVGVSMDENREEISRYVTERPVSFPIVWDETRSVSQRWRPAADPEAFVVDRRGVVRFAQVGYHEDDFAEIEGVLDRFASE
jgi:hypothetical protein